MSGLEIFMAGMFFLGLFAIVITHFDHDAIAPLVVCYTTLFVVTCLLMWVYSCSKTDPSVESSTKAEILKVSEKDTHIQFDYIGLDGMAKSARFESVSDYLKYKNGSTLHIENIVFHTYFGPNGSSQVEVLK